VDAVRAEFFEYPHYPASTMVGVADLLGDEMLVEVEIEAEIPREGRTETPNDAVSDDESTAIRDRREPLTTVLTREGESLTVDDARAREGLDEGGIEIEFEVADDEATTADDDAGASEDGESETDGTGDE
jgi:hypothetical protein